jgi:hypothetical protein
MIHGENLLTFSNLMWTPFYRGDRNIALYQAHRRQLVRGLPFRIKVFAGKQSFIWGPKERIRPHSRVTMPLLAPSADSFLTGKKIIEIGGEIRPENGCSARPWGRRRGDLSE